MIDRLILYFTNFFVHLENWGAILMDPVLLACLMIAVHDRKPIPSPWAGASSGCCCCGR